MSTHEPNVQPRDTRHEARPWAPGDPDRRKSNRTLLELTGTTPDEHRPAPDDGPAKSPERTRRANNLG